MEVKNAKEELVREAVLWCFENEAIVRFDVNVIMDPRRPKKATRGVLVALPKLDVSGAHPLFEEAVELCKGAATAKLTRLAEKIGA